MPGDAGDIPAFVPPPAAGHRASDADIARAADLLTRAKRPGIFCGWGAVDAGPELRQLAESLGAPVATTLQGLSSFPANHPLHAGFALGPAAVPASENAFRDCDCLLAVGTRFAEIPTGSYGYEPPANLIHVDINPRCSARTIRAMVALEGDAGAVLGALGGGSRRGARRG